MFGLTTLRRLTAEVDAHLTTIRARLEAEHLLSEEIDSHIETIRARNTAADALDKEHRVTRLLAEQLLDATGHYPAAARTQLGLPPAGPWERAVEGLNALVDADVLFHIEPDGHISNSTGDEHIEWDRTAKRWRLVHDTEDGPVSVTVDDVLRANVQADPDGSR
ncbi:hypothetical protein [Streptomyces sp. NPDC059651]|uniref:hypothetical protein n=1 Tax=Streptomyces sp. NPDC059651 TaxID=3346897 RepID=UPI0036BF3D35